jgi:hypothetical protein
MTLQHVVVRTVGRLAMVFAVVVGLSLEVRRSVWAQDIFDEPATDAAAEEGDAPALGDPSEKGEAVAPPATAELPPAGAQSDGGSSVAKQLQPATAPYQVPGTLVGRIDGSGKLMVRSVGVIDGSASLIDLSGQRVSATIDSSGQALIEGVRPGLVSIVINGKGQHAAIAVYVVGPGAPASLGMPAIDVRTLGMGGREVLDAIRPRLPMSAPMSAFASIESLKVDRSLSFDRVRIQDNGTINGRIHTPVLANMQQFPLASVIVRVTDSSGATRQATTDTTGRFTINNASEGYYDLVAAGPAGYAAFRLFASGSGSNEDQESSGEGGSDDESQQPVALLLQDEEDPAQLDVILVPPPLVDGVVQTTDELADEEEEEEEEELIPQPPIPPPVSGFLGGGGGGLGGLGSDLIGLAGLGAFGYALSELGDDDNNNNGTTPPVTSPSVP